MQTPEGREKAKIKHYLDALPRCWHYAPVMTGFGKGGVPDRVACIDGVFWGIEVKREGKMPTERQSTRMNEIRAAGGQATWGTAWKVCSEINSWRELKAKRDRLMMLGLDGVNPESSGSPSARQSPPVAGSLRSATPRQAR